MNETGLTLGGSPEVSTENSTASAFLNGDLIGRLDLRFFAADHPGVFLMGRIDARNPKTPVLIWQGTEMRARFTGRRIGFRFADAWGQNFFNVIIDGKIHLLRLLEEGAHDYLLSEILPEGSHELILFKRSEALFSHAAFCGILLEAGGELGPNPGPLPLRLEFYGDSITAGACNEDPGADQYDDCSTHNNYMSYGAIASRNLNADYVNLSVSGTGVCYSWNPVLMPEIYDKLYPEKPGERYLPIQEPDAVIINLGQNDYGFSNSNGQPFPADFATNYVKLVRNIRKMYPQAHIICAIGGMSAYRESQDLQSAFENAVNELKAGDKKIKSLVFEAFSINHPRVDIHIKLAEELTAFILEVILRIPL